MLKDVPTPSPEAQVTDEERNWMNALCEQIAVEQNYERLTSLIHELNELLEGKQRRLEFQHAKRNVS